MTKPDIVEKPRSALATTLIFVLAPLAVLFSVAFAAGMIVAGLEKQGVPSLAYFAILALAVTVGVAAVWLMWRNRPAFQLPTSPRMRKSRIILYVCLALGVAIGAALVIAEGPRSADLTGLLSSSTPISPVAVGVLLAGFLASMVLSIRWHMLLDEHEMAAYNIGAVVGLYVYFTLSVLWWLLARGGLAPAPDGYAIFWAVMLAWIIGWLFKRYR